MDKDLISRSALLKILRVNKDLVTKLDAKELFDWTEAVIDVASSVDAEPVRHGRWIRKAHDKRVNYLWTVTAYCSECCDEEKEIWSGYFPNVPDWLARDVALQDAAQVKMSSYCPNCGAKMDAEE